MSLIYNFSIRYREASYWRKRTYCQNHNNILSKIYLINLRRIENAQCASTGLGLGNPQSPMCKIEEKLNLPHRLNGIIIARNVEIGRNVTIFQHVTIAEEDRAKKTIIEDNVVIGAGAVILKNVRIGKGAKIGANAVVTRSIPQGGIAVGVPARLINAAELQKRI